MRRRLALAALLAGSVLGGACANEADDCTLTLSCGPVDTTAPCEGTCLVGQLGAWDDPYLVWLGAAADAPACPDNAPVQAMDGVAPPDVALCAACACEPPTGTCGLPATVTAAMATCADKDASTATVPFDPPLSWDGSCTTFEAAPGKPGCSGASCIQSVEIGQPPMHEGGCAVKTSSVPFDTPPHGPTTFQRARVCGGLPHGECSKLADVCRPAKPQQTAPDPDGVWTYCVVAWAGSDPPECPKDYPTRRTFGASYTDDRTCEPCGCTPPEGSECSALVTIYGDASCTPSEQLTSGKATSAQSSCHDVPAGSALGSKKADAPVYTPGTCTPTGGAMGSVVFEGAAVLCCLR